jgi:hypothetical protein
MNQQDEFLTVNSACLVSFQFHIISIVCFAEVNSAYIYCKCNAIMCHKKILLVLFEEDYLISNIGLIVGKYFNN